MRFHHIVRVTACHSYHADREQVVRSRGAQNLPVIGDEALKRLELDKGLSTFEDDTVNVPIDTITNSITTLEFVLLQVPSAEPDFWLKSQFVLMNDKPTVAGVLLFADEPQAALPKRSAIKVFRYATREAVDVCRREGRRTYGQRSAIQGGSTRPTFRGQDSWQSRIRARGVHEDRPRRQRYGWTSLVAI